MAVRGLLLRPANIPRCYQGLFSARTSTDELGVVRGGVGRAIYFSRPRKDETSDNRRSMQPQTVTGIACEFGARRRSPPHNYSIVAPTARRISVPCHRMTFATLSLQEQTLDCNRGMSAFVTLSDSRTVCNCPALFDYRRDFYRTSW
jgi:hypothetical protein